MKKVAFFLLWVAVATGSSSTQVLAQSFSPIRINSAGGAYTDSQGHVWSADTAFSGGTVAVVSNAIANTVDDVLYQSERWGASSYTFTVPARSYQVTLKFAETVYSSSGQRIFNVAINGTTVLANFDIVAAAGGPNIAVDRTFTVNAGSGSNNLQIQFIHLSGQPDDPKVDAIDIESGTATPTVPNITTQPISQTVVVGQTATFSVAATGTAPLSYQWRKNGANIGGATSSSYTTPTTTTADTGAQFSVVVSNSAGSATSNNATLTVNVATVAPSITTQPSSQTVTAGQTASFSVSCSGTSPFSFQWRKNGVNLSGATSSSYTTPATTTADSGAQFSVFISNSIGSVTSSSAALTVNAAAIAPSITTQPSSQTVTAGQTATFSVAATGTAPLSYQWRKNGVNLSGATSSSYTTPATTTADSGAQFDVQVSNSVRAVTSSAATLTVSSTQTSFTPIRINSAGGAYTDSQGHVWSADTSFSGGTAADSTNAIANTVDDVLYQSERWGASTYTFTVPTGSYLVTLKFAETWFTSSGQRLFNVAINGTTVLANFDIVAAAGGPNIAVDQTFTVNAGSGSNNLQIQFIHMSGQPDDPKVDAIDIESGTATPTAPNITTQPVSQTVVVGQTATFSVAATGTAPLAYQWRKTGANISGATSSTYTTQATTTADSGAQFSVVVSNSAGSATSGNAALTVSATTKLLSPNPTNLSFGNVSVSLSSLLTSTLTNTGNSNVTISKVSMSGAGLTVSGLSTGQIIAPGQSGILSVTFLPALTGSVTGSVVVTSDASNSPTTISLSGTGVLLVTHSATLSWSASSSSVAGYNVYSGTVSGGPYNKITTSPVAAVSYKDSSVQSGKTYYYVVTSINSSSVESAYSNQVSAAIP